MPFQHFHMDHLLLSGIPRLLQTHIKMCYSNRHTMRRSKFKEWILRTQTKCLAEQRERRSLDSGTQRIWPVAAWPRTLGHGIMAVEFVVEENFYLKMGGKQKEMWRGQRPGEIFEDVPLMNYLQPHCLKFPHFANDTNIWSESFNI